MAMVNAVYRIADEVALLLRCARWAASEWTRATVRPQPRLRVAVREEARCRRSEGGPLAYALSPEFSEAPSSTAAAIVSWLENRIDRRVEQSIASAVRAIVHSQHAKINRVRAAVAAGMGGMMIEEAAPTSTRDWVLPEAARSLRGGWRTRTTVFAGILATSRARSPNAATRRFSACELAASLADRLARQTGGRRHQRVSAIANRCRLGGCPQPATTLVQTPARPRCTFRRWSLPTPSLASRCEYDRDRTRWQPNSAHPPKRRKGRITSDLFPPFLARYRVGLRPWSGTARKRTSVGVVEQGMVG